MTNETPMKLIIDCATGEESYVPLSEEELAQREIDRLAFEEAEAARIAAEEEKAALKESANAKLLALGLTEEEIAAITN
jgi:hypothetical protein